MVPALYVTRRNGVQERTEQARQKASQDDLLREAKTHFGLLSLACVAASSLIAGSRGCRLSPPACRGERRGHGPTYLVNYCVALNAAHVSRLSDRELQ